MRNNTTIFKQILQCLPVMSGSNVKYVKHLTNENLLIMLIFAQINGLNSLRDIETSAEVHEKELKKLGIKSVSRSNLAHALKVRDCEFFKAYFLKVNEYFKVHCCKNFKFGKSLKIIDSSIINVCLKLFPWANYQQKKGALKMHMMLDFDCLIPDFTVITDGNTSDLDFVREKRFNFSSDSIYVFDRGYLDYKWYYSLTSEKVGFVTRIKKNMSYDIVSLLGQQKIDKNGWLKDETISYSNPDSKDRYPENLRLVTVYDAEKNTTYEYITNIFSLDALTIRDIYKSRWEIESFFRWIKQNLKIKSFLGTSMNAVKIQIYAALIYYILLMYLMKMLNFRNTMTDLSRRIRACILEKLSFEKILSKVLNQKQNDGNRHKQWEQMSFLESS